MNELEDFRAAARAQDVPDDVIDWWLQLARPRLELDREGDGPVAGLGNPIGPAETDVMLAQLYLTEDIVGEDFECDLVILFCMITRDDLAARRFDMVEIQSDFHG